jgi:hypothetical protein
VLDGKTGFEPATVVVAIVEVASPPASVELASGPATAFVEVVGAGTKTVTVTMTVFGGPPGIVEPGTCTMMICGGAVASGEVLVVDVAPVSTGVSTVASRSVTAGTVVSGVRPDRLMSEATIDPVTEAAPMIAAAIIGPHFVKLMRPWLCGATLPSADELAPAPSSFTPTACHRHESDCGFTKTVRNGAQTTGPTTHCGLAFTRAGCFLWNGPLKDELGSLRSASPSWRRFLPLR